MPSASAKAIVAWSLGKALQERIAGSKPSGNEKSSSVRARGRVLNGRVSASSRPTKKPTKPLSTALTISARSSRLRSTGRNHNQHNSAIVTPNLSCAASSSRSTTLSNTGQRCMKPLAKRLMRSSMWPAQNRRDLHHVMSRKALGQTAE